MLPMFNHVVGIQLSISDGPLGKALPVGRMVESNLSWRATHPTTPIVADGTTNFRRADRFR